MMSTVSQTMTRQTIRRLAKPRRPSQLRIVYPLSLTRVIPLDSKDAVLGRLPSSNTAYQISDPTVSRNHLRITWDRSTAQHVAEDLDSRNGSRVDDVQVGAERATLTDGSIVRIGDVLLVYECNAGIVLRPPHAISLETLPGVSGTMRSLQRAVSRAAADPSSVLVIGETGTGKEFVVRELHRLSGRRGRLLALNCAELSPQLIESQLFGHERGAFTGATSTSEGLFRAANGGTLLLDEIGELPLSLQPKLLRVLQEGEVRPVGSSRSHRVNVRVVAATNRNLAALVATDQFRRDLYARLALWDLHVPAIRERRSDILSWIHRLHERWCARRPGDHDTLHLAPCAAEAVLVANWDENLRGIDRLIHRLAARDGQGRPVVRADVEAVLGATASPQSPARATAAPQRRAAPNRNELEAVMDRHGGSVRAVAKYYGRERRQVYRWLKALGLRETG